MALTATQILSTIRDNASKDYIARVPEVTRNNLSQVGDAITSDKNIMNEFLGGLIEKIAYTNIINKMFKNPFAILKNVGVPMGNGIEEIFINPTMDAGYSTDQKKLLTTSKPDGKVCYYSLNRRSTYPQTINKVQLSQAFSSEQAFMEMYNGFVTAMYSGDEIDEFMLIKGLLGKTVDSGAIKMLDCDIAQPKEVSKAISNVSKNFAFPSTNFSGYNLVNADAIKKGATACTTWCPITSQALIIRADIQTEIDYEVLASMFNMELAKLQAMTILVDDIPSETYDVYAILCDRNSIQMRDKIVSLDSQYIGSSMEYNYWLHHWEYIFFSMFGNACAFGKAKTSSATTSTK